MAKVNPFTGELQEDDELQQMISVSTGAPINRNLLYDKSEIDAMIASVRASSGATGPAGGDLSGTYPNPSVVQAPKLTTARNIDGVVFDGSANVTVIAPGTHAATSKATPVDADELPLVDSAASNVLKKLTWANLKATLKTYFDSIYQAVGAYITASSSDVLTNKNLTSGTNTFPTFNQDTTGSAAKLATGRTFQVNLAVSTPATFDGSANVSPGVTGILPTANGGTTLSGLMPNWIMTGGTTGTGAMQQIPDNTTTSGMVLTSRGGAALPTWQAAASSGPTLGKVYATASNYNNFYT